MRISIVLLLALLLSPPSQAQFFSAGQAPFSVKWQQINTENFQLIFPDDYAVQAQYIANILEYIYGPGSESLQHRPRKISVIIHNQTVISNGFVAWAPRRMELFTNPPANNDPHDWMERLVVHEYRHVVQIDKLNQGMTRLLSFLLGEQAIGAMAGLQPMWFLEGDAVVMETALTHGGRGRMPHFEQGLRAQVLTHGIYSFDKAYFGSYKNHVPNFYELGYQLVANARIQHGAEIWKGVVDYTARRPYTLTPFSFGMRKEMGKGANKHYKSTLLHLDSLWRFQKEQHIYSASTLYSPNKKHYTHYIHPYWINDSTLIALRTAINDIPKIVSIDTEGKEEALFSPGWFFPKAFHYAHGKIVWNEQRPDSRFAHRNWSDIVVYDLNTHIRRKITDKTRYFTPSLSSDGNRIACIETFPDGSSALVIIDAQNGSPIFEHRAGDADFLMQPFWHPSGDAIGFIALNEQGKRIELIRIEDGETNTLLAPTHIEISSPRFWEENILFNGAWSGINNIYLLNTQNSEVQQVVSSVFASVYPNIHPQNQLMVFSHYDAEGYALHTLPVDSLMYKPLNQVNDYSPGFHQQLKEQENFLVSKEDIPQNEYKVENYSRLRNLFHLHSWAPASVNATNQEIGLGASVLFHNKLSTSFATLAYDYDMNEQTGQYSLKYTYEGWMPVIDLSARTGKRRLFLDDQALHYHQNNLDLSISIPLRQLNEEYVYQFVPIFRSGLIHATPNAQTTDTLFFSNNAFFALQEGLYFFQEYRLWMSRQIRRSSKDIYPPWGQMADISYKHSPWGVNSMGRVAAFRLTGFFPGLLRHHGLRLSAAYQHQADPKAQSGNLNYSFGNSIAYPRGVRFKNHEVLQAFSMDYAFPFMYPDFSIPGFIYIMRLRANIFRDYALGRNPLYSSQAPQRETLKSFGVDILTDMHFLRTILPLSLGVRNTFLQTETELEYSFEFLFSVNF